MTPLAMDELNGPGGEDYPAMIQTSSSGRVGTLDEIGGAAAFLLGADGAFVNGSDLLIDGGGDRLDHRRPLPTRLRRDGGAAAAAPPERRR